MYDPLVNFHLPEKRPDRVLGLLKTKAFQKVLDSLESSTHATGARHGGKSIIRCSPFKECEDPLLFPFLILEAKSERNSKGFNASQIQTAFPIWALLKLQEGLQVNLPSDTPTAGPLVWFISNQGDYWRVYGCYATNEECPTYVSFILIRYFPSVHFQVVTHSRALHILNDC